MLNASQETPNLAMNLQDYPPKWDISLHPKRMSTISGPSKLVCPVTRSRRLRARLQDVSRASLRILKPPKPQFRVPCREFGRTRGGGAGAEGGALDSTISARGGPSINLAGGGGGTLKMLGVVPYQFWVQESKFSATLLVHSNPITRASLAMAIP